MTPVKLLTLCSARQAQGRDFQVMLMECDTRSALTPVLESIFAFPASAVYGQTDAPRQGGTFSRLAYDPEKETH
jgi:hypothetical protein